jgi:GT2 family glycosyltransferase
LEAKLPVKKFLRLARYEDYERVDQLIRLYQAVLRRNPDIGGLTVYLRALKKGVTVAKIVDQFMASGEYRDLAAQSDGPSRAELIERITHPARDDRWTPVTAGVFPRGVPRNVPLAYHWWLRDQARIASTENLAKQDLPMLSILMLVRATQPAWVNESIASIRAQLHGRFEFVIVDHPVNGSAVANVIARHAAQDERIRTVSSGVFTVVMGGSEILSPDATFRIAMAIRRNPDAAMFYCDNDLIDQRGVRHDPRFRTAWDPDAGNDIGSMMAARTSLIKSELGVTPDADELAARIMTRIDPGNAVHIPRLLYSARVTRPSALSPSRWLNALLAGPETGSSPPRAWPADPPRVTIVIPTHDQPGLLRNCLDGILERTDYPALDVVIIDNRSRQPETLAYLATLKSNPRVTVLTDERPFNWGAINNSGIRESEGEVIILLNDDTEVLHPDWLWELVRQAVRPDVGVVGAKLLYPDDTIQHAGIVLGPDGHAMHRFRGVGATDRGYLGALATIRSVSAVTGACMAFRREVFDAVGGLEETSLVVTWSDTDFCLRARALGYRVLWTPFARLRHIELATRGADDTPEKAARALHERDYMMATWPFLADEDPFFNPNLALEEGETRLAAMPRLGEGQDYAGA